MVMRMADADVLPFQFSDFADTIHTYVAELKTLLNEKRDEAKERDKEIEDGVYQALYDPKKQMVPPPVEPIPPYLNFAPLDQASDDLTTAAQEFDQAFAAAAGTAPPEFNLDLIQSERTLTNADGLPNRPWFQHLIYAPGFYTGYGVKTIPGVREAIEQKDWKEADAQIVRVSAALERQVDLLKEARAKLPPKAATH
jgi:N-acetylated-alpha-linked acidic dipeptidase